MYQTIDLFILFCYCWWIIPSSPSTKRASQCTRQQHSTGPTFTPVLSIGWALSIKAKLFWISNFVAAPRVWGHVEAASRHGHWRGDLKKPSNLSSKPENPGSCEGGALLLWVGSPESDWNSFQLNVTKMWQMWPAWLSYFKWLGCWGRLGFKM